MLREERVCFSIVTYLNFTFIFYLRFLLVIEPKHNVRDNDPIGAELLDTSNKCDGSNRDECNGSDKRKHSEAEESTSQEPKKKKWDKKNRGQNKVCLCTYSSHSCDKIQHCICNHVPGITSDYKHPGFIWEVI